MLSVAATLLLAGSVLGSGVETRELARIAQCPPPAFDEQKRDDVGGDALVGADGRSFFYQCGDGKIWRWREGDTNVSISSAGTVFGAAQEAGTIPADLRCLYSFGETAGLPEPNCRIQARSRDGRTFVIHPDASLDYVISRGGKEPIFRFDVSDEPIVFFGDGIIVANDGQVPNTLQLVSLKSGARRTIANLPSSNLIFENGEGSPGDVGYSEACSLLVIAFNGAFRVARSMHYLSAFGHDGRRIWSLKAPLPDDDGVLITGEITRMRVIGRGRYAAVARVSVRSKTELVDVETGHVVGTVPGWLVEAASDGSRLLLTDYNGELRFVELSFPDGKLSAASKRPSSPRSARCPG